MDMSESAPAAMAAGAGEFLHPAPDGSGGGAYRAFLEAKMPIAQAVGLPCALMRGGWCIGAMAWTPEEDAKLRAADAAGETLAQIMALMPGRSRSAIANRLRRLKLKGSSGRPTGRPRKGAPTPIPTAVRDAERCPTARASRRLLLAMLRHGVRKPEPRGLPGLPAERFLELLEEHGVSA